MSFHPNTEGFSAGDTNCFLEQVCPSQWAPVVPQKRPGDSLTHCRWHESISSGIQGLDTGKGAKAAPQPAGTREGQPAPAVWPGGFVRCTQSSHARRDAAPAPTMDGDGGGLGMFRMIDQDGFAISLPRAINLKMVLSLFDFHRKKRLFLKWIVTAKFRDNRLAMTRLHFLESKQQKPFLAGFGEARSVVYMAMMRRAAVPLPNWLPCPLNSCSWGG